MRVANRAVPRCEWVASGGCVPDRIPQRPIEAALTHDDARPTAGRRLLLFVASGEPNSALARDNLVRLLDTERLPEWELVVIDVLADPGAAREHGVLVAPTLVVPGARPPVRLSGRLDDRERVLAALRPGR